MIAPIRSASRWLLVSAIASLAFGCRTAPPPVGEQPFAPPRAVRGMGVSREAERLSPEGDLGAPVPSLADALARVAAERAAGASGDVFVVVRESGGWRAWVYGARWIRGIRLEEIETSGLPLAADPENPRTYVVDTAGHVGKLVVEDGGFSIRRVAPTDLREPISPRPFVTGFVVPDDVMLNHATNVEWSPAYAFRSGSSRSVLSDGLRWISEHLKPGISIRAIGSRHSWSPVAATDGVSVLPDDARGIERIADPTPTSGALVRVLAGTTIREVNHSLAALDLAIPYLGGFDGQTIGGVLATGTHGSVLALGPLADLIRSIDLVRFDGHVVRIEPARRRITDPATLAASAPASRPELELRVDDDLFDAVRMGIGAFGVIHSLVLETAPKYWLREVRTLTTLDEICERTRDGRIHDFFEPREYVLARLRDRDLPDYVETRPAHGGSATQGFPGHPFPAFHFEILWNPYGKGTALITTRHWVDACTRARFEREEPSDFDAGPRRDLLRFLDPRTVRFSRPGLSELLAAHIGSTATSYVEHLQRVAPKSVPELVDASIRSLVNPCGYVRRSYDVFNIGDATNLLPSLSATISVPLRDDLWLRAVDILHRTAERLLTERLVETAPVSLRFVAASSALLADPEEVCKFEIIFAGTGETARCQANRIVAEYYAALRSELGDIVHLHFGQLIPPGTLDRLGSDGRLPVATAYPGYATWRRLRDELDPREHGLSTWLRTILP